MSQKERLVELSVSLTIGDRSFSDRFMWDLGEPQNSAEEYAYCVCADEGLGRDFVEPLTSAVKRAIEEARRKACAEGEGQQQAADTSTTVVQRARAEGPVVMPPIKRLRNA